MRRLHDAEPRVGGGDCQQLHVFACLLGQADDVGEEILLGGREDLIGLEIVLAGNVSAAAKAAGDLCDDGPHLKRPYDPQAVLNHLIEVDHICNRQRGDILDQ